MFKQKIIPNASAPLIESESAIQCVLFKDNEQTKNIANSLQKAGLDVRPILSPTVPSGSERIRICLHSFNTDKEISLLTDTINKLIHAR